MKRLICVILACLFLTSCAYNKITIVKIEGKKLRVPIFQGLIPIEGEGLKGVIIRQVNLLPWWEALPEFFSVEVTQEGEENKILVKK